MVGYGTKDHSSTNLSELKLSICLFFSYSFFLFFFYIAFGFISNFWRAFIELYEYTYKVCIYIFVYIYLYIYISIFVCVLVYIVYIQSIYILKYIKYIY